MVDGFRASKVPARPLGLLGVAACQGGRFVAEEMNMNMTSEAVFDEASVLTCESSVAVVHRPATVAELVRAAQAGDRDAFGLLFERFRSTIFALAMRRVRNADEADELTQDVFIKAMQKIDQLRTPDAFGGWLRQIVHRMAINRITRNRSALACDPETLEATCLASESPQADAEDREQAAEIRGHLGRLGSLDQETLTAFYLQSKSLLEMSNEFDAPVGTIKRRLHVARKRLAKEMELVAV